MTSKLYVLGWVLAVLACALFIWAFGGFLDRIREDE